MFAYSFAPFSERETFIKTHKYFFEGEGTGEPISPKYTKFIKDFNWFHIVSTLADHQFLKLEEVLDANIVDVLSYLTYMSRKAVAEKAQRDYMDKINHH